MISITSTAITISPELVAGEIVPVSLNATGMDLPDAARLYLAARAYPGPGWLLGACELEHGEGATWTGSLNLATCPAARWFFGAGADESRRILLELVEQTSRDSLLRLATTLRNSALLGCADGTPAPLTPGVTLADVDAEIAAALAALHIPAPGAAAPAMDGTAAPGTSPDYARADHVHPSDTSRAKANEVVKLTGDQEIAGNKTFNDGIVAKGFLAEGTAMFSFGDYAEAGAWGISRDENGNVLLTVSAAGVSGTITIPRADGTMAFASQIPSTPAGVGITPETWTFTVDDGQGGTTTVTKSVCVVAAQQQGA